MKKSPKVSVVITCYNREKYISEAIESALKQTYENIEIIISDNCSTDNSINIINTYNIDPRVVVNKNKENIGAISNFKKAAFEVATGDYITFISSDDYLCDIEFISKAINRFIENPDLVIVKARNVFKLQNEGVFHDDRTYYKWKNQYYNKIKVDGLRVFLDYPVMPSVGFGGALYKRSMLQDLGFAAFGDKIFYQDAEITLKILLNGSVSFLNDKAYVVRLHGENETGVISVPRIIDNCGYIDSPYLYAKNENLVEIHLLQRWRNLMYQQYFSGVMKSTYHNKKIEFKEITQWLKLNHPNVLSSIETSFNWRMFTLLTRFNCIRKVYHKLGLLKSKLFMLLEAVYHR